MVDYAALFVTVATQERFGAVLKRCDVNSDMQKLAGYARAAIDLYIYGLQRSRIAAAARQDVQVKHHTKSLILDCDISSLQCGPESL